MPCRCHSSSWIGVEPNPGIWKPIFRVITSQQITTTSARNSQPNTLRDPLQDAVDALSDRKHDFHCKVLSLALPRELADRRYGPKRPPETQGARPPAATALCRRGYFR